MTIDHLVHRFVTSAPAALEPEVLYVSIAYDTTIHLCACGCGSQVVLPLHPTAWRLTYDGDSVSMYPSVGNWSFPCRSHYWIERGRIRWAPMWTDAHIAAGRQRTLRERGLRSTPAADQRAPATPSPRHRLQDTVRRLFRRG